VREFGGLYVLGTERHESRRIDNQLRGRSGRQGDPGESRFYLSAQDDLVRLFAGDRIYKIVDRFKLPDDMPMEASILTRQIEGAQKKVEEQNFVTRKNVLKYDDVMNVQRMVIYDQRRDVLEGRDLSEQVKGWIDEVVERIVLEHAQGETWQEWEVDALFREMQDLYDCEIQPSELDLPRMSSDDLVAEFQDDAQDAYALKEEQVGTELMREIERYLVLQVVDVRWREHLEAMEYLRDGIHLRAMAQKDPLVEYRNEGSDMFTELNELICEEVVRYLFHVEVEATAPAEAEVAEGPQYDPGDLGGNGAVVYEHESLHGSDVIAAAGGGAAAAGAIAVTEAAAPPEQAVAQPVTNANDLFAGVGRNELCPCGSGKKFKKCHGA
jgi:preprotein translocase subunit SecA